MSLETDEISFKRLFIDLFRAVVEKNLEKVEKIYLDTPDLLFHEERSSIELLLVQATYCDNEEIIKLLFKFMKSNRNENNLDRHLKTALNVNDVRLTELLLKNGAKLDLLEDLYDEYDEEPYFYEELETLYSNIIRNTETCMETLKLLSYYEPLDTYIGYSENNPLHLIAKKNRENIVEIAEFLLNSGVPLDDKNDEDDTPMKVAISCGNTELVTYLIEKGADVNAKDLGGQSLLFEAIFKVDLYIFDMLLSNGAEVNAKDDDGRTPLHLACNRNQEEIISLLLREGADVCAKDYKDSETPYSELCFYTLHNDRSKAVMIKEFSKRTFENLLVCKEDIDLVKKDPNTQKVFDNCLAEVNRMANTKFYEPYTYYTVLNMWKKINKLANLARNEDFVNTFQDGLSFFHFNEDLDKILDKAIYVRDCLLTVESRLKSILGNHCPDIVIRILAKNLTVEDLPLK